MKPSVSCETVLRYTVYYSSCPTDEFHGRETLSCKTGDEFNLYYEQIEAGRNYSWYCHFDDDVYVNSPELQKLLSSLEHEDIYYLGIRSILDHKQSVKKYFDAKLTPIVKKKKFVFAGGHAYCMSKKLMNEMERYARGKVFVAISINQSLPDDITVGFIVEAVLGYNLTEIDEFNSHRTQNLDLLTVEELRKQITISYKGQKHINLPNVNKKMDPTRFLSYHCLLYPFVSWCVSHRLPNLTSLKRN